MWASICTFAGSRRGEWKTPQSWDCILFALLTLSPPPPIPGPLGLGHFQPTGQRVRSWPDSEKCGLALAPGGRFVRQLTAEAFG